jgi:hypothetical protein
MPAGENTANIESVESAAAEHIEGTETAVKLGEAAGIVVVVADMNVCGNYLFLLFGIGSCEVVW